VAQVVPEGQDMFSVYVRGHRLHELQARAGQFFRWRFLTRDLWWVSSPFSLSAPPQPNRLRITVKALGDHSGSLTHLAPGTRVFAEGPYGAMTAARRRNPKVLLIAGGVGITPIRALFETLPAEPGDLTLLYRASEQRDVLFLQELESLAEDRGARLHIVVGRRGDLAGDPLSAAALRANLPDVAEHDVYVCGPPGMTVASTRALRAAGVPRRHIHHESFEF
jgi:ferredoxin-NADP reductase